MPDSLASTLLTLVGGASNVVDLTHCMMRLRFSLHDHTAADRDAIGSLDAVAIVLDRGGQLQIGVRRDLVAIYHELVRELDRPTSKE